MLFSKILSKFLLFTLILCIFIYPASSIATPNLPHPIQLEVGHQLPIYHHYDLTSYDSMLQLIEDIANEGIQDKSAEQLEYINRIITLLAEQGPLTSDPELLQEDIAELLGLHITPCGYTYTPQGRFFVEARSKKTIKNHKIYLIIADIVYGIHNLFIINLFNLN